MQDFESRKRLLQERTSQKHSLPKQLASVDRDFTDFPFLQVRYSSEVYRPNLLNHNSFFKKALANREELVRTGKLTTIIFIRDYNSKNQEVSGYIDYAHRLRTEDFVPYFERR